MQLSYNRLLKINSWDELFADANSLKEKEKGDLFEYLTKQVLITKPEYNSILKNVWLYKESPNEISEKLNLPLRDEGIDLVAETFQGKYWAIQCKFKGICLTLLEIIEDSNNKKSLIITSQLPAEHWYDIIGEKTLADAMMDRLVYQSHRIELKGESMRKKRCQQSMFDDKTMNQILN